MCRAVTGDAQKYWTGFVSTGGGSFKLPGDSGNWYGDTFKVAVAETRPSGTPIYEWSKLRQETPVWNMSKLPEPFLTAIYNDRDLQTGQYFKSQFVVECLQTLGTMDNASGIYFPSRRTDGGVVILNPQVVSIEIVYTGQLPPTGLL